MADVGDYRLETNAFVLLTYLVLCGSL